MHEAVVANVPLPILNWISYSVISRPLMAGFDHIIQIDFPCWVITILTVLLGTNAAMILMIGLSEPQPCLFFARTLTL